VGVAAVFGVGRGSAGRPVRARRDIQLSARPAAPEPIRYGLFGTPLFARPLERHFGWVGLLASGAGGVLALASLVLGLYGWPIDRLWLYLVGSALLILVGVQLMVSWILMEAAGGRAAERWKGALERSAFSVW
jgi:hypothetical protein